MKQPALIMIILIVAGLVLAGAGVLMQKSAPPDQGRSIVAGGWTNPTKPTVQDWADMASNITSMHGNGTVVMDSTVNFTTSWLQVSTSGTNALNFTTASAGSYLITANLRENTTLTAPITETYSKYALCDADGTTIVSNTERLGSLVKDTGNFTTQTQSLTWVYTNATGSSEVGVCVMLTNAVDGFYGLVSDADGRSTLSYVRLP